MTSRTWTALIVSLTAVAGVSTVLLAEAVVPTTPAPTDAESASKPPLVTLNGTAGCGAIACHGGPIDVDANGKYVPASKNAYTWWTLRDKHSNAYNVLFDPRSVRMMRNLRRMTEEDEAKLDAAGKEELRLAATRDARCLACHTVPQSVLAADGTVANSPEVELIRSEGVSCEACHGPAVKWKGPHTAEEWQTSTPDDRRKRYAETDMVWLNDLGVRAQKCVGCHVGAPADPKNGIPVRDVNHDLIAAGHPKLSYEMLSYTENEPPHWVRKDRSKSYDAVELTGREADLYDAKLWLIGQVSCAEAAVGLLQDRLTCAQPDPNAPEWEKDRRWPELAEYECYGCHHNLVSPSWRQIFLEYYRGSFDANPQVTSSKARKPGSLVWASWNVSKTMESMADKRIVQSVSELRRAMGGAYPKPTTVEPLAQRLKQQLAEWLEKADAASSADARLDLVNAIPQDIKDYAGMNWDDAAQMYLACEALARANGPANYAKARQPLRQLFTFLRLPRPSGNNTTFYDSPVRFLPRPLSQVTLDEIRVPALPVQFVNLRNNILVPGAQ